MNPSRIFAHGPHGFSLIELLAVLAVLALTAAFSSVAFNSLLRSRGAVNATYEVAGLLVRARSEAMTRQTYVWVGFASRTNAGERELLAAAVSARDADGSNTSAANLQPMAPVLRLRGVALASWPDLKSETRTAWQGQTPQSVADNQSGISFSVGQTSFDKCSITFTPKGEALLAGPVGPDDGFTALIDVSLLQTRGGVVPPGADDASVVLDGATGGVKSIRVR